MLEENKVYLLSRHEFVLLAAGAGIRSVYGFSLDMDSLDREASLHILQQLTAKGYMQAVEGRIVPVNEMCTIFNQIKDAETTIDVHKSSGRNCIIYVNELAVKVSQSMRRKDTFEIMLIPKAYIWRHLQEEGWISTGSEPEEKGVLQ